MVGGWLLKVILGFAVAGIIAFEIGSPLITRGQADDAAHEVADEAAFDLRGRGTPEAVLAKCQEVAARKDVELRRCELDANEAAVHVTVAKEARSIFMSKLGFAEEWYDIEVSAIGRPPTQ